MLKWDKKVIEYLDRAETYSHFAENIVSAIKPYLTKYGKALEIGCGIGNVSIEFSKVFKSVTCTDISVEVIDNLKIKIEEKNIKNIATKVLDSKSVLKEKYDLIFASFFFEQEDFIRMIKENLTNDGVAIYIFRKNMKHAIRKNIANNKNSFYEAFEQKLIKEKLPYKKVELTFHKDQPFIDDDDIKEFCKLYNSDYEECRMNVKNISKTNVLSSIQYKYLYEVKRETYVYIIRK